MPYTTKDALADAVNMLLDFARQELDERKHSGDAGRQDCTQLENAIMGAECALDAYELDKAMDTEPVPTSDRLPDEMRAVFADYDAPPPLMAKMEPSDFEGYPVLDTGECSDFTDLPDPREEAPGSGALAAAVIMLVIVVVLVALHWTQDPACRQPGVETFPHCVD